MPPLLSHPGTQLTGTWGTGLGGWACLPEASWEDGSWARLVSWTISWLEQLERRHRDTYLSILATSVLTDYSLVLPAKAKQTRGAGGKPSRATQAAERQFAVDSVG